MKQHFRTKVECVRFKFCLKIAMEEENCTKKGSGVTFSFYSSPPLLFNFYDVLPYFYYASRFMIEYVMEDIEFRNIPFSVDPTMQRRGYESHENIICRNNIL